MSDENFRVLSDAISRRANRPSSEQYDEMVRRGAIDREGNVILRRPERPDSANGVDAEVSDHAVDNIIAIDSPLLAPSPANAKFES